MEDPTAVSKNQSMFWGPGRPRQYKGSSSDPNENRDRLDPVENWTIQSRPSLPGWWLTNPTNLVTRWIYSLSFRYSISTYVFLLASFFFGSFFFSCSPPPFIHFSTIETSSYNIKKSIFRLLCKLFVRVLCWRKKKSKKENEKDEEFFGTKRRRSKKTGERNT